MLEGTYWFFSPSHICAHIRVSSGFVSYIGTISPCELRKQKNWELKWEKFTSLNRISKHKSSRSTRQRVWKHIAHFKNMRTLKFKSNEHSQNGSESTNQKLQTMTFWTYWSKLLCSKESARKCGAFRFWLTLQKNPKSKDLFDITGRVLSEIAVITTYYTGTSV